MERVSRLHPTRSRTYCFGRCVTGPRPWLAVLTLVLIVAPVGCVFALVLPDITEHYTAAPAVVTACVSSVVLASFAAAACSDPGIVERAPLDEDEWEEALTRVRAMTRRGRSMQRVGVWEQEEEASSGGVSGDASLIGVAPEGAVAIAGGSSELSTLDDAFLEDEEDTAEARARERAQMRSRVLFGSLAPPTKDIMVRDVLVKVKYCVTCRFFRPPRVVHCSECDNCVRKFDHHCPWIGNCVGERNYKYFLTFVLTTPCLAVWAVVLCVWQLAHHAARGTVFGAFEATPAAPIIAVYAGVILCTLLGLSSYHLFVANNNTTTNERLKWLPTRQYAEPRGCVGNWARVCCVMPPPSVRFTEKVDRREWEAAYLEPRPIAP